MENIKIQRTVYPDVQLTEDQWKKEFRVGIRVNDSKRTDLSGRMMSLYDSLTFSKYLKKLRVG